MLSHAILCSLLSQQRHWLVLNGNFRPLILQTTKSYETPTANDACLPLHMAVEVWFQFSTGPLMIFAKMDFPALATYEDIKLDNFCPTKAPK